MAPAGGFDCLQAAIQGGADSVYFGIGRLNMRSRSASNFQPEDLPEVVRICREAVHCMEKEERNDQQIF